jgi:hypothetical protein
MAHDFLPGFTMTHDLDSQTGHFEKESPLSILI